MRWSKQEIERFIRYEVAPYGEALGRYDDRMLFEDAVKYASWLGEDGKPLLDTLLEMGNN